MRKTVLFLLLATVAAPSFAAQDRDAERDARKEAAQAERAERAAAREERQADRPQRAEAGQDRQAERQQVRAVDRPDRQQVRQVERNDGPDRQQARQVDRNEGGRAVEHDRRREVVEQRQLERRSDRQFAPGMRPTLDQRRDAPNSVRDWRRDQRIERRVERRPPPVVSNVPREGTQPPPVNIAGRSSSHHWNGSWRNDHRYDWYNWRNRNRSIFRLGFYFDPFGWDYRPYSIGWRLWPSYYNRSSYWLDDPWMYRLPPAYPGTRWIRYYDDALLVDTWNGEVVDVIYEFFW